MAHDFRKLTEYLRSVGTDQVAHSEGNFLGHLVGVYRDLKNWGCPEHIVLAGLFHSIYGTESFQGYHLPWERRSEVAQLIGERAERLVYVNCLLSRPSLDASVADGGAPRLVSRLDGTPIPITDEEYTDLITLHLCDRLEQAERVGYWDWRRQAWEDMARRLGGVALANWERVYGQAPPPAPGPEAPVVHPAWATGA